MEIPRAILPSESSPFDVYMLLHVSPHGTTTHKINIKEFFNVWSGLGLFAGP